MSTKPNEASAVLRAAAALLLAQADALDAVPDAPDELLDVSACKSLGAGRDALTAAAERGELQVCRGPRRKLLVKRSELNRWLASKPYVAKQTGEPAPDLEAWERSVRRAS